MGFGSGDSVDFRLMEIKFFDCDTFGDDTIRVTGDSRTLLSRLSILLLDIGAIDWFVANDPSDLIDHIFFDRGSDGDYSDCAQDG